MSTIEIPKTDAKQTITILLTPEAFEKLEDIASSERRLPEAQAEVLLLMALGKWPDRGTLKSDPEPEGPRVLKPTKTVPAAEDGHGGALHHGS